LVQALKLPVNQSIVALQPLPCNGTGIITCWHREWLAPTQRVSDVHGVARRQPRYQLRVSVQGCKGNAEVFFIYLKKANTFDCYPELCFKLSNGFPIGKDLLPITILFMLQNAIESYIFEELQLGHFCGPFLQPVLEAKIGPFSSLPI